MKILLFRTDPSVMNIKSYNSQEIGLAKAYLELGHECDIVYYNANNESRVESIDAGDGKEIKIYWMKGFSFLNNGFFPGISKLIEQYDVIQVSEYYFFASWYVYKKFAKKKQVYVYQGVYDSDNSKKFKLRCKVMDPFMLTRKVKKNTLVFTKSVLAEESMKNRGFENVKTVGVGLDKSRLGTDAEMCEWTKELIERKGDSKYLLYVGVLEDRRNTLFLLDVLKSVAEKDESAKLVIVGRGSDEYVSECMKKIEELGISDKVIYKDGLPQEELKYVYEVSDAFLLPTKYEIFGMVIMEAMSFGLPVITSYNGGSSTLINNGENGIIINNFNENEWSDAVLSLNDESKREAMGSAALETSKKDFSWLSIAQTMIKTLSERKK